MAHTAGTRGSVDSEMLLQSLRCSSPAIEAHLNDGDLCIPRYDIDEANESPGKHNMYDLARRFRGRLRNGSGRDPMVPAARHVQQKGVLTDLDLFLCIAQAGMGSPYSYFVLTSTCWLLKIRRFTINSG